MPVNQQLVKQSGRARRVAELYAEGRSQRDVAEALGISQPTVSRDLKLAVGDDRRAAQEAIGRLREREGLRLEQLESKATDALSQARTERSRIGWFREIVRVLERRSRLLGLDAAERTELHVEVEPAAKDERQLAREAWDTLVGGGESADATRIALLALGFDAHDIALLYVETVNAVAAKLGKPAPYPPPLRLGPLGQLPERATTDEATDTTEANGQTEPTR